MNEMTLKLPGGGILAIRAFPETEQDNVRVEFFEAGENPDADIGHGHGAYIKETVFAAAVRNAVDAGNVFDLDAGKIPDFVKTDFLDTDRPYAYLYGLAGKVSALRWNQIKARLEFNAGLHHVDFDPLYTAYSEEAKASAGNAEETDKAGNSETPGQPLDRDQRLYMIAQAVDGMRFLDWKKARRQIDRMFERHAALASNRATIGKTPEEIVDTIKNERM